MKTKTWKVITNTGKQADLEKADLESGLAVPKLSLLQPA
jgi:hypothetical protein